MKKIVVDSDIIAQHLVNTKSPSILRKLLSKYFCYTTVLNTIELFSLCKSDSEKNNLAEALTSLKILGMNPKPSKLYSNFYAKARKKNVNKNYAYIAGLCCISKLPLATLRRTKYKWTKELQILNKDTF